MKKKVKYYDFIIGGAGIVGSAIALELKKKFKHKSILLLDKESSVGYHQTGHNSGVIHSGIYYKPNSLKSKNCLDGYRYLLEFCKNHKIPFKLGGKIIAARNYSEEETLSILHERSKKVQLKGVLTLDSKKEVQKIEPHLNVSKGLYVPQTGVVDYTKVCHKMVSIFKDLGGECLLNTEILTKNNNKIETSRGTFQFEKIILAIGLQSDRIIETDYRIIPFRGEYFKLNKKLNGLVKSMVYPVPDLKYPFLGLHFTKGIDNNVEIGPNALLAFAREKYESKFKVNIKDLYDLLTNKKLYSFVWKNKQFAKQEIFRSLIKSKMTREIKSYFPKISKKDFVFHRSGIRAQVMDPSGTLVDDFIIENNDRYLHVLNAPSPAATSCISIAKQIIKFI